VTETRSSGEQQGRTLAYVSLGSAIIGWLGACAWFVSQYGGIVLLLGNIIAVVTGYLARNQARRGGSERVEKIARLGLILGAAGMLLGVLLICALLVLGPTLVKVTGS